MEKHHHAHKGAIDDCLDAARVAVQRSDAVGGNEQETREIRAALRALIQALDTLADEVRRT